LPAAAQRGGGSGFHGAGAGHGGGFHGGGSHWGGFHGGGGWYGGGPGWWGLGLGLGLGVAYLANPYAYYPYPGYAYPNGAAAVIVNPDSAPPGMSLVVPQVSASAPTWYYCESARTYYPYVKQCPEAWQAVPAVPPGPVR
jgi:hypothetical protein